MKRWTRRGFIVSTAATTCVGCLDPDEVTTVRSRRSSTAAPGAGLSPGVPGAVAVGPIGIVWRDVAVSPVYVPAARAWVVAVADGEADTALAASDERLHPGIRAGLMALHQKCPHLGCRVPFCESSGWFECACHGTKFTRLGEHREGPGPRGLDAFPIVVTNGVVTIDVGQLVTGHPAGTVIVDAPPSGPSCVDAGNP